MTREQVQIPIGGTGEESDQEKKNAPKGLNRPAMPLGLERPRALTRKHLWLRRRCSCGSWTCGSPGHGWDGPCWYWEYFDTDGQRVPARENNLPLRGWGGGSKSGYNVDASNAEISDFNARHPRMRMARE